MKNSEYQSENGTENKVFILKSNERCRVVTYKKVISRNREIPQTIFHKSGIESWDLDD